MFGETSKLNAVDTGTKFKDFIADTNVVDLCKKEYCISTSHAAPKKNIMPNKTEILEKFKSGEVLGNDLPSCQRECSDLKKAKDISSKEKSACDSRCSKHYNLKGKDEDWYKEFIKPKIEHDSCKKKCIENEEAIKSAAKEYYENQKEEMAQKVSDDELEARKARAKELIDKKYTKSIEEANKQLQESQSNAEKMKQDQETTINSLTKEKFVEIQNVDAEKMKQELLDKIKEIMSPKQEFLNLLVKENYVIDKVCKNDYCNKQAEKELSQCNLECEDSKEFGIFSDQEYKGCKTKCQKKESKKHECEGKCYLKQEDIKSAAKEYSQEINTSKEEFDTKKMEKGFFDKVEKIMENREC